MPVASEHRLGSSWQRLGVSREFLVRCRGALRSEGQTRIGACRQEMSAMNLTQSLSPLFLLASACLTPALAQVSISLPLDIDYGSAEMIDVNPATHANGFPLQSDPMHITAFGDGALFAANMGAVRGRELWFSDGTPAGTRRVKNLYPLPAGGVEEKDRVGHITVLNGRAFFAGRGANGIELWVSDGTEPGTQPFADINPGPADSKPQFLTRIGQEIFFAADDGTHGLEPWMSDGQTVRMIADTVPGSNPTFGPLGSSPRYFAGFGPTPENPRRVVFQADDGVNGRELWFTDGSLQNTYRLADILPGSDASVPWFMTPVSAGLTGEERVVFSAKCVVMVNNIPQVFRMPWTTDFTPEGTQQLVQSNTQISGWDFARVGNQAYFTAAVSTGGYGVWRTDGTPGGTEAVYSAVGGTANQVLHMTAVGNGRIYGSAVVNVGQAQGRELVRFDQMSALGFGVHDINPSGGSDPRNFLGGTPGIGGSGDHQSYAVAGNKIFMSATREFGGNPFFSDKELVVVDNGATAQPEHWGCGSSSLEADDPVLGTLIMLRGRTRVPNATSLVILTRPGTPIPIPGFTGCQFFGSFSFFRPLVPRTGSSFGQFLQIPNDTSLHLQTFMAQSVVVSEDPVTRFDLSNPLRLVLGTH